VLKLLFPPEPVPLNGLYRTVSTPECSFEALFSTVVRYFHVPGKLLEFLEVFADGNEMNLQVRSEPLPMSSRLDFELKPLMIQDKRIRIKNNGSQIYDMER
jgi:hypothetical protein